MFGISGGYIRVTGIQEKYITAGLGNGETRTRIFTVGPN